MQQLRTINKQGTWFKGNLHNHTNLSDGELSPQELIQQYKNEGYSFISITDHWIYGTHQQFQNENFLIFGGVEFDIPITNDDKRTYHIVAIGNPQTTAFPHGHTFSEISRSSNINGLINFLNDNEQICVLGHPCWSQIQTEELDRIEKCLGVEIFNNGTFQEFDKGFSETYYDRMLWTGKRALCFGCDDTHPQTNLFGGFIQVKSESLSYASILNSILSGSFYASNGPSIFDFYIEDNKVYVECSNCSLISIHGKKFKGKALYSAKNDLNFASFKIGENMDYVYAICQDAQGHKAWTQPIWLKSVD
ncbi:MAG: hypothetical protein IKJ27_01270 [Clostridia bacterium]|nr:hypothetical protein [Clostridia bacterium]